jgi:cupin fold WbuC family metalloprotein
MRIRQLTPETSYILDRIAPGMTTGCANSLIERYKLSTRRRHQYCFHQNPEVDLHDIIICYDSTSYIPPNKHVCKVESLLIIDGEIDFFLFSDNGQVYDYRRLSAIDSSKPFYVRVPPNTWHGLRVVGTKPCIIKETISGPDDNTSLKWAPFAPSEANGSETGHLWYDEIVSQCLKSNISPPPDETFEQINDILFRSSRQLVTVGLEQLKPIISAAQVSPLRRARLCCHNGPQDHLQEMFIALAPGVDIEESVHLRKDESLTVLRGQGCYLFPNEDGSVRREIDLAPFSDSLDSNADANFFTRINRYVPHKILVNHASLLIHEATTGPFIKSDTDYRLKSI